MARKTIKSLESLLKEVRELREYDRLQIKELETRIREKDISIKHLSQIANAFDRLLDGVCAGMKEANLPRRAH